MATYNDLFASPESTSATTANDSVSGVTYKDLFPPEQSTLADASRSLASGLPGIGGAVGFGLEKTGIAPKLGRSLRESAERATTNINAKQSPLWQEAAAQPLINDDYTVNPEFGLRSLAANVLPSIAGTIAMGVAGGPLANAATKGLSALGVGAKVASTVGSGVGFGATEGALSGAQNADQWGMEQRAKFGNDPAKEAAIQQGESDIFADTAIKTGGLSALTGGGMMGVLNRSYNPVADAARDGFVKATAKSMGLEALQEAPQSALEQRTTNQATRDYIDPNQDINAGVLNAGVVGGLSGGVMGAVGGVGSLGPLSRAANQAPLLNNQTGEVDVAENIDNTAQTNDGTASVTGQGLGVVGPDSATNNPATTAAGGVNYPQQEQSLSAKNTVIPIAEQQDTVALDASLSANNQINKTKEPSLEADQQQPRTSNEEQKNASENANAYEEAWQERLLNPNAPEQSGAIPQQDIENDGRPARPDLSTADNRSTEESNYAAREQAGSTTDATKGAINETIPTPATSAEQSQTTAKPASEQVPIPASSDSTPTYESGAGKQIPVQVGAVQQDQNVDLGGQGSTGTSPGSLPVGGTPLNADNANLNLSNSTPLKTGQSIEQEAPTSKGPAQTKAGGAKDNTNYLAGKGFTPSEINEINTKRETVKDIAGWARGRFGYDKVKGVDFNQAEQTPIAVGDSVITDTGVPGKVAKASGNILSIKTDKGTINKRTDKVTKVETTQPQNPIASEAAVQTQEEGGLNKPIEPNFDAPQAEWDKYESDSEAFYGKDTAYEPPAFKPIEQQKAERLKERIAEQDKLFSVIPEGVKRAVRYKEERDYFESNGAYFDASYNTQQDADDGRDYRDFRKSTDKNQLKALSEYEKHIRSSVRNEQASQASKIPSNGRTDTGGDAKAAGAGEKRSAVSEAEGEIDAPKITKSYSESHKNKSGDEVIYKTEKYSSGYILTKAIKSGKQIGFIDTRTEKDGDLYPAIDVFVELGERRNGVATKLYDIVEKHGGLIAPLSNGDDDTSRSPEAQAFRENRASIKKSSNTQTTKTKASSDNSESKLSKESNTDVDANESTSNSVDDQNKANVSDKPTKGVKLADKAENEETGATKQADQGTALYSKSTTQPTTLSDDADIRLSKSSGKVDKKLTNEERDEHIEEINAALQRAGQQLHLVPADPKTDRMSVDMAKNDRAGRGDTRATPRTHRWLAEKISGIFGKQVIWIKADGGFSINGLVDPVSQPDVIYIDVRSKVYAHVVMGHELNHHIRAQHPKIYNELLDATRGLLQNQEQYKDKLGLTSMSEDSLAEEMLGDILGDSFGDPKFWNEFAKQNPSLLKRLSNIITEWLNKFIADSNKRGFGSEQWVTDAKAMRQALVKAVAQYASAVNASENNSRVKFSKAASIIDNSNAPSSAQPKPKQTSRITTPDAVNDETDNIEKWQGSAYDYTDNNGNKIGLTNEKLEALVAQYAGVDGTPSRAELKEAVGQYRTIEALYFNADGTPKNGGMMTRGKPTNLNKAQWIQTRTENFKKWFAGSQVVDENGDPLVTGDDAFINANGQAKSASSNVGTFNPQSSDARFSRTSDDSPIIAGAKRKAGLGPKKTLTQAIRDILSRGITANKEAAKQWWAELQPRLEQGVFDKFYGIKLAEKEILGDVAHSMSGYISARLSTGSSSTMQALLLHGAPKWAEGIIQKKDGSKGFAEILKPVKDDLENFTAWMVGRRADRLFKEGKENNFSRDEIDALLGLKQDSYQAVADDIADMNSAVLDLAQESGLVDAESRKLFESNDYIPFYRLIEGKKSGPSKKGGLSHQSSGIKMLKGGDNPMSDPLGNMMQNWAHLIDASMKNDALNKTLVNLEGSRFVDSIPRVEFKQALIPKEQIKKLMLESGLPKEVVDLMPADLTSGIAKMWALQAPTDPDVVRVMRGGQSEYFRVNDAMLLTSLSAVNQIPFGGIFKPMRYMKHLLTSAVTADPTFMARNFIRDSMHSWTIAEEKGFKMGIDSFQGAFKSLKEEGGFVDMMFAGASFQGGYGNYNNPDAARTSMDAALRKRGIKDIQGFRDSILDTPKKYWEMYRSVGDAIENANREAILENSKKAGSEKAQYLFEAKDLMDFSMQGSFTLIRAMSDMLPFFNARLIGLYRLAKAGKTQEARKMILAKGLSIAMFSLALLALNSDNDDYEALEDFDKDQYWHFFFGDQHYRIPKPFELGLLFGTIPERSARMLIGKDSMGEFAERMAHGASDTLAFNPVPQMFKPFIELYANKDMFTGRAIEGMADEGKLPSARYNEYTSETMRALSDVLPEALGASPKRLEHLMHGFLGSLGMYALGASDMMVRELSGMPVLPESRIDRLPIVKAFYQEKPTMHTKYGTEFHDMLNEVNQIYRTINAYKKEGNFERANELRLENADKLRARKPLESASKSLSKLRAQVDVIYRSKLSASDKRSKIDALMQKSNDTARLAVERSHPYFN